MATTRKKVEPEEKGQKTPPVSPKTKCKPEEKDQKAPSVSPKNKLNALTAKEWISESVSVWRQKGLGAGHPDAQIEKLHPAPFSFTDVSRIIKFFSKPGEKILDPFVGIGSSLKAAALEGRHGIGIELNSYFADLARGRLRDEVESSSTPDTEQVVIQGDCRTVLKNLENESVQLVVTSPPYWNILHKKDHKAKQEREQKGLATRYSEDDIYDLGNIDEYSDFLDELVLIFGECARILETKKHMCIVVGDFRDKSRYHMFHADLANRLESSTGLVLKGITILYQPHKRLFPYGYPAAYVPNLHHQYILTFRKDN
jgi:DNA modification methylase